MEMFKSYLRNLSYLRSSNHLSFVVSVQYFPREKIIGFQANGRVEHHDSTTEKMKNR